MKMFKTLAKGGNAFSKISLALTLLLGLVVLFQPLQAFAASVPVSPTSAVLGSVFTISGSGYTANERVNLTTVDPSNTSLGAGYIYADANGNFTVKVYTTDPDGLAAAAGTNYTQLMTDYNSDGSVADQYLKVILFKPATGSWTLNAVGATSGTTQNYSFAISTGTNTSVSGTTTPTAGTLGTVFSLKASGFQPGEKVNLWTTDPNNKALSAGYILADANGDISIQVNSSDPDQIATTAGTNYTNLITDYNSDGSVADQYLQVILYNASTGNWALTAQSSLSNATTVFNFTIQ